MASLSLKAYSLFVSAPIMQTDPSFWSKYISLPRVGKSLDSKASRLGKGNHAYQLFLKSQVGNSNIYTAQHPLDQTVYQIVDHVATSSIEISDPPRPLMPSQTFPPGPYFLPDPIKPRIDLEN